MLCCILHLEAPNVKGLGLHVPIPVLGLDNESVIAGKLRHDGSKHFCLAAACHAKTIDVCLYQTDGIAATGSVPVEVGLAGLVARMTDDNGVYLTPPAIADIVLDIFADSSFPVEFIAKIGSDIIHTDLFFERLVFFKHRFIFVLFLFLLLPVTSLWLCYAPHALAGRVPCHSTSVPKQPW